MILQYRLWPAHQNRLTVQHCYKRLDVKMCKLQVVLMFHGLFPDWYRHKTGKLIWFSFFHWFHKVTDLLHVLFSFHFSLSYILPPHPVCLLCSDNSCRFRKSMFLQFCLFLSEIRSGPGTACGAQIPRLQ